MKFAPAVVCPAAEDNHAAAAQCQHCWVSLHPNTSQLITHSPTVLAVLYAGTPITHILPDLRPLPIHFPTSILQTEGATYHFWWSQIYNFGTASSCAATRTPQTLSQGTLTLSSPHQWKSAPGWLIHAVVWSNANVGSNAAGMYLPLAAVMTKDDTMAIIIRGTETFSDWEAGMLV